MSRIRIYIINVVFLISIFLFIPLHNSCADVVVGVSPPEINSDVEKDTIKEFPLHFSRSEEIGELKLKLSKQTETTLFDIQQEYLIFLDGEKEKDFIVKVNTSNIVVGEYNNIIYFHVVDYTKIEGGGPEVVYGLGVKTKINVVEKTVESLNKNSTKNNLGLYYMMATILILVLIFFTVPAIYFFKKKKKTGGR